MARRPQRVRPKEAFRPQGHLGRDDPRKLIPGRQWLPQEEAWMRVASIPWKAKAAGSSDPRKVGPPGIDPRGIDPVGSSLGGSVTLKEGDRSRQCCGITTCLLGIDPSLGDPTATVPIPGLIDFSRSIFNAILTCKSIPAKAAVSFEASYPQPIPSQSIQESWPLQRLLFLADELGSTWDRAIPSVVGASCLKGRQENHRVPANENQRHFPNDFLLEVLGSREVTVSSTGGTSSVGSSSKRTAAVIAAREAATAAVAAADAAEAATAAAVTVTAAAVTVMAAEGAVTGAATARAVAAGAVTGAAAAATAAAATAA
ncbi:hypothetical protein Efla_007832 [Eimeria flavescens]